MKKIICMRNGGRNKEVNEGNKRGVGERREWNEELFRCVLGQEGSHPWKLGL